MAIASNCKATPIITAGYGAAYLRTADAAAYLGIGQSTLERMRIKGTGPSYRVLGARLVTYAIADLDEYASRQVRKSTSQLIAA